MGHYEDFFVEMTQSLDEQGLRGKFDSQLQKMRYQDKHQNKDIRDKWRYAFEKIISEKSDKNA
jgi:hypothetical protein|tara:strand:+ start:104 stop:292 length:189 start_codon:yes stop_codon:yes gene_type:complete